MTSRRKFLAALIGAPLIPAVPAIAAEVANEAPELRALYMPSIYGPYIFIPAGNYVVHNGRLYTFEGQTISYSEVNDAFDYMPRMGAKA